MGVGKTLQAITMMDTLLAEKKIKRVIVVCPSTLKRNFINEIEKNTKYREYNYEIIHVTGTALNRTDIEKNILKGQLSLMVMELVIFHQILLKYVLLKMEYREVG